MTRQFIGIAEHCVAIEPAPVFYQTLHETTHFASNLEIFQLTLLEYERIAETHFDVVFLGGVLPYLDNKEIYECLNCVRRLLQPWGLVFVRELGTTSDALGDGYQTEGEISRSPAAIKHVATRTGFECKY